MSSSTRRRTCPPCSTGRSAAAARPARRPSSATSRRARPRGRRASWEEALAHLGKPEARVEELTAGLPRAARGDRVRLPAAARHRARAWRRSRRSVRRPGFFDVRPMPGGPDAAVVAACRGVAAPRGLDRPDRRRRPDPGAGRGARRRRASAYLAPGEETTARDPPDPGPGLAGQGPGVRLRGPGRARAVVDGEPDERTGLRRLYVALTRAVSGLIVMHAAPLPAAARPERRPAGTRDGPRRPRSPAEAGRRAESGPT